MRGLTMSQVAQAAQVIPETVRYYERRGLIAPPPRTGAGYRMFPPEAVEEIRFIKQAQLLGFTLQEIKVLLGMYRGEPVLSPDELQRFAAAKVEELERRITEMNRLKALLDEAAAMEEPSFRGSAACPVLRQISEGGMKHGEEN